MTTTQIRTLKFKPCSLILILLVVDLSLSQPQLLFVMHQIISTSFFWATHWIGYMFLFIYISYKFCCRSVQESVIHHSSEVPQCNPGAWTQAYMRQYDAVGIIINGIDSCQQATRNNHHQSVQWLSCSMLSLTVTGHGNVEVLRMVNGKGGINSLKIWDKLNTFYKTGWCVSASKHFAFPRTWLVISELSKHGVYLSKACDGNKQSTSAWQQLDVY